MDIGEQLGNFYAEWHRKLQIVKDRSRSEKDRLEALHWIDVVGIGTEPTPPEELENLTDELLKLDGEDEWPPQPFAQF